jgi:hypothetical protein
MGLFRRLLLYRLRIGNVIQTKQMVLLKKSATPKRDCIICVIRDAFVPQCLS